MIDKKRLKLFMVDHDLSMADMASVLGINEATLYRKVSGTSDFTRNEIQLLKNHYNMSWEQVEEIFFAA